MAQLKLILEELNSLNQQAKYDRVKALLDREATNISQEISAHERRAAASKPTTIPTISIQNFCIVLFVHSKYLQNCLIFTIAFYLNLLYIL